MNRLIQALVCFLMLFAASEAAAVTVTINGTLRYNRNWSGNGYSSVSDIPAASRTGVQTLKDVKICMTPPGGTTVCGWTNSNGEYSLTGNGNTGTWTRQVRFIGQSRVTTGADGYRVVVSATDQTTLTYNMSSFSITGGGTFAMGGHTIATCGTPSATCANDFANGHQVLQWAATRWTSTYQLNTISGFNAALDTVKAFTDRQSNLQCGFGGNPFCFNFDYNSTDITTGWHEAGHTMLRQHITQLGSGQYGEYPGQTSCSAPEEDSGGNAIDEGIANLNSVLMGYSENAAGTLSTLGDFCFSTDEPANDSSMSCVSCEYGPNPNVYPQPSLVCGDQGTFTIQRTECRVLKLYINLLDSQSNTSNCINEAMNLSYKQLWQIVASVPNGATNCEGCVKETQLGAVGNAIGPQDAFSVMDILEDIKVVYGVSASELYKVWANACYIPGEAGWAAGEFLPSSQQGTPFP